MIRKFLARFISKRWWDDFAQLSFQAAVPVTSGHNIAPSRPAIRQPEAKLLNANHAQQIAKTSLRNSSDKRLSRETAPGGNGGIRILSTFYLCVTLAETAGKSKKRSGAKHVKKWHNTLQSSQIKCNILEGVCCGDEHVHETWRIYYCKMVTCRSVQHCSGQNLPNRPKLRHPVRRFSLNKCCSTFRCSTASFGSGSPPRSNKNWIKVRW